MATKNHRGKTQNTKIFRLDPFADPKAGFLLPRYFRIGAGVTGFTRAGGGFVLFM